MSIRRSLSLLLTLVLLPPEAFAQSADWQRVRASSYGDSIVVTTRSGERYHGEFAGSTDDLVSLNADERAFPGRRQRRREVPKGEVREIRRYKPWASAMASAGIGAAVGAGLGAGIESTSRSNEDRGLLTFVTTFFGIVIGFGIGLHKTLIKGERIYIA